jgi:hypothetical protein
MRLFFLKPAVKLISVHYRHLNIDNAVVIPIILRHLLGSLAVGKFIDRIVMPPVLFIFYLRQTYSGHLNARRLAKR